MPNSGASIELVRQILLSIPSVREGTIHGVPSFKLRGRIVACPAIHKSAEPNSLVVSIDRSQRAALIAGDPALYIADHYAGYDVVLLRLSCVSQKSLRALLDGAVRFVSNRSAARRPRAAATMVKKSSAAAVRRRRPKPTA